MRRSFSANSKCKNCELKDPLVRSNHYKDKDFSTNGIAGTLDDNYHWLTNEDFNLFRKNTNNGEDFLIFSEVEKQSLSAKIHNK